MTAPLYSWGPPDLVLFVHGLRKEVPRARPALSDDAWAAVDRVLDDAIAATTTKVLVVLAPDDAVEVSRSAYVWYEPLLNAVVAIGHTDRTVDVHCDADMLAANRAAIEALLDDAHRELARGDLAQALSVVAASLAGAFRR